MPVLAIDFEASCLPRHGRSYPIEVGLAGAGRDQSWLIRPHDDWAGWDWTAEAQALHGLTHAQIMREGAPAHVVLAALADAVAGCRVVADSLIDSYWLEILARAAGRRSPFMIDHVSTLIDEWGVGEDRIAMAVAEADLICPARHRAGSDARWLATLVENLGGQGVMAPVAPLPAPVLMRMS